MGTVFHKTPPPWLDQVSDLRPGESRRIGDGRKVSFNGLGYFLWDFREKEGEQWNPSLSLAEKLELLRLQNAANNAAQEDATPPGPKQEHPKDWPVEARVWMHKAQFTNDEIVKTGAYWNAELRRVVLPYRTVHGQQSWIARRVLAGADQPSKYLMPKAVPRSGGAMVQATPGAHSAGVVITEDLLSAYRVTWADAIDTVALQGTTLDRDSIMALVKRYRVIYVWLDPDSAGTVGGTELVRRIGRLGVAVMRVTSKRDPKYLTPEDIQRRLDDAQAVA